MPLHCTAIGKTLLAFSDAGLRDEVLGRPLVRRTRHTVIAPGTLRTQLDRIRNDGVAYEFEESATGGVCVGAPIWENDNLIGAVSVTGPSHRFRPQAYATHVRAAADNIGHALTRRDELRS